MAINNRYLPSHPQGDNSLYGLDFTAILPPGVAIGSATVTLEYNSVPPTATSDWTLGVPIITGRRVYAQLEGGLAGRDYRVNWRVVDSLANQWTRTCLLQCAATS